MPWLLLLLQKERSSGSRRAVVVGEEDGLTGPHVDCGDGRDGEVKPSPYFQGYPEMTVNQGTGTMNQFYNK